MKKKLLSVLLLSLFLVGQSTVQAFAITPKEPVSITYENNIETITYSDNEIVKLNTTTGEIEFSHNGKKYSFNTQTDYVGYNKANKYAAVLFAQKNFNRIIGTNLALDGIFGSSTHKATETYQRTRGLSVDCIIGPTTWEYIIKAI